MLVVMFLIASSLARKLQSLLRHVCLSGDATKTNALIVRQHKK